MYILHTICTAALGPPELGVVFYRAIMRVLDIARSRSAVVPAPGMRTCSKDSRTVSDSLVRERKAKLKNGGAYSILELESRWYDAD